MKLSPVRSFSSLLVRARVTGLALGLAALGAVTVGASSAEAQGYPYAAPFTRQAQRAPFFGRYGRPMRAAPTVVFVQQPVAPAVAPPPSDADGYLVLGTTPLVVGQAVRSYWGASYYPAQVLAVNADGTVRVHYTGWSDMWDGNVSRVNLRIAR